LAEKVVGLELRHPARRRPAQRELPVARGQRLEHLRAVARRRIGPHLRQAVGRFDEASGRRELFPNLAAQHAGVEVTDPGHLGRDQQHVPIGGRTRDLARADATGGAGAIVHHDCGAVQHGRHGACHRIDPAARREGTTSRKGRLDEARAGRMVAIDGPAAADRTSLRCIGRSFAGTVRTTGHGGPA
jgi:hypothetical protein